MYIYFDRSFCFFLLFGLIVIIGPGQATAQTVEPANNPCDATTQCALNNIDQYVLTMEATPTSCGWPNEAGCQLHDPNWFAFVAGGDQVDLTIHIADCQLGNGVQFSAYEGDPTCAGECNFAGLEGPLAGNCGAPLLPGANPHNFTFPTQPGFTYYLVFDGYSDDLCEVTITIDDGGEFPIIEDPQEPNSISFPEFDGPDTVCVGAENLTVSIPSLPSGASKILWSIDDSSDIEGPIGSASIDIPASFFDTAGTIEVCATAVNECDSSNTVCKEYAVANIDSTFEEFTVCEGDDFAWEGNTYDTENINGDITITDQITKQATAGCQYQAHLTLNVINENSEAPNQVHDVICGGETYSHPSGFSTMNGVEGQEYVSTNAQGCDEYYNFTIEVIGGEFSVLPPDDCNGDGTLTLETLFTPVWSNTVSIDDPDLQVQYQWFVNSDTIPGATGETLTVTSELVENNPFGQYNVHVTMTYEGETCEFVSTTVGLEAADFLYHNTPVQCTFEADTLYYDLGNTTTTCSWPKEPTCQLDNPQWGAFVADGDSVRMNLTISDCMPTAKGIQFAVYEGEPNCFEPCNFSGLEGPLAGNCNQLLIPSGNPHTFTYSTRPGYTYYYVIDGYEGDTCEVSLVVDRAIQAPRPDLPISDNIQISGFQGSDTICAGAENLEVFLPNLPDSASRLHWTLDTAEIEGAMGSSSIPIPNRFIDSAGRLNICVQAVNDCAVSDTVCRSFSIANQDSVVEQYSVCEGDSFSWDNGPINTDNIEEPLVVEQYAMRYDTNGCPYSAMLNLTIYPTVELIDTSIVPDDGTGNGSISPELSGDFTPYTYLWSTGDTTQNIDSLDAGEYTLTVTNSIGCSRIYTFELDMEVATDPVSQELDGLEVFPNPLTERSNLTIHWERPRDHSIKMYDTRGQLLYEKNYDQIRQYELQSPDLQQPGLYLLIIETSQERGVYRIVVQ